MIKEKEKKESQCLINRSRITDLPPTTGPGLSGSTGVTTGRPGAGLPFIGTAGMMNNKKIQNMTILL